MTRERATTTISSREFNEDTSGAMEAAKKGPVFITDRGRPVHVLLTIEEYEKLAGEDSIIEQLAMPGVEDVDFEPPRLGDMFKTPSLTLCALATRVVRNAG